MREDYEAAKGDRKRAVNKKRGTGDAVPRFRYMTWSLGIRGR
ncbi:hypothetical protein GGR01_000426 [Acetobacter oeni]|nr:hypothetical protein [Acetobacter oeni]